MIRLGLRLAIGREAILRLVMIAVAVALGVGMLLGILAWINAVQKQGDRYAIINTSATTPGTPTMPRIIATTGIEPAGTPAVPMPPRTQIDTTRICWERASSTP